VTVSGIDSYARSERSAYCDLVTSLGPDAPTLCEGWTTRDLTAHLAVRERRPDASAGIIIKPLAAHAKRVQDAAAGRPFDELVALVRHPSPLTFGGFGPLDRAFNTSEFFIHHEDVRRAQPGWDPRPLPSALANLLWSRAVAPAKLMLRRYPASIVVDAGTHGTARMGRGGPEVRVAGDPGELALFLSGRQRAARVVVTGPDDLVARLSQSRLGI
jgi:uncharacterized protein (TIGR03085 family)